MALTYIRHLPTLVAMRLAFVILLTCVIDAAYSKAGGGGGGGGSKGGGSKGGGSTAAALGGASRSPSSGVSNTQRPYVPPCQPPGSDISVNMAMDPLNRCASSCFTVVAIDVSNSTQCAAWSNRSAWDGTNCKIDCSNIPEYNRTLPNGTCVVGADALPVYPGVVNVSDNASVYAVPLGCPTPPWVPPCRNVGLSVDENMKMDSRCFAVCFTVVAMWITTGDECGAWSGNAIWDEGWCRMGCENLLMFNESLANGTCVVNGTALPIYPGVVNVSDNEDLYSVPMECVGDKICVFSLVKRVSNNRLCEYSTPRLWISVGWAAFFFIFFVVCYTASQGQQLTNLQIDLEVLGAVFLVAVGVVWEFGVVCLPVIGYVVYKDRYRTAYTKPDTTIVTNVRIVEEEKTR